MSKSFGKYARRTIPAAVLAASMLATSAFAASGDYNSKGILTVDDTNIYIDAADISYLDDAIEDNSTTLTNYDATAGDIYNNLDTINKSINTAKTRLASNLKEMKISIDENGSVYSADEPNDWSSDTVGTSSTVANTWTLEKYISAMTQGSVTGGNSQRNAVVAHYTAKESNFGLRNKTFASITGIEAIEDEDGKLSVPMKGKTDIFLGVDEMITLPKGYYGSDVILRNGIINRTADENTVAALTAGVSKTYPAGYYDEFTVTAKSLAAQTEGTAVENDILEGKTAWVNGKKLTGDIKTLTQAEVNAAGAQNASGNYVVTFPLNRYTGKANTTALLHTLTRQATGTYAALSNGDDNGGISADVGLSATAANTIKLGIKDSVKLPAGYYAKDTTIQNSVIYRGSPAATLSAGGLKKSLAAGYYDAGDITITKSTVNFADKSAGSTTDLNSKANWSQALDSGDSVTVSAGAVYAGKVTVNDMTGKYTVSGTGTAGASGNAVTTNTSQLYWDMGVNNMNRYVLIAKSNGATASLNAGGSKTISAGYLASAITITANKPTGKYTLSGTGTAGKSGNAVTTNTSQVYWDMGETSMNRYVIVAKSDGATASLNAGGSKTISAGYLASAVTVSANKPTGKYTVSGTGTAGKSGNAVTTNTSQVYWDMGETSMNRYVIIAKSDGAAASLNAGGSKTISAGYLASAVTVTANKPTGVYEVSGTGTAGASGKPVTKTANVYWDMGETNMQRYVSIPKSTASATSLNPGGSATIPVGYVSSAITVTAKTLASQTAIDSGKTGAGAEQILTGYQAWVNGSKVDGSMANNGAVNATLTAASLSKTIPKGYTTGGTVSVAKGTAKIGTTDKTWANNGTVALSSGQSLSIGAGVYYAGTVTAPTAQEKPGTAGASAVTVTPDTGKVLSKVTIAAVTKDSGVGKTIYDAGVAAGKAAITGSPSTASVNTSGATGNNTVSVTAGYYNKVTINQKPAYDAGYNAGVTAGKKAITASIKGDAKAEHLLSGETATIKGGKEITGSMKDWSNVMQDATTDASNSSKSAYKYELENGRWKVYVAPANGYYGNWDWAKSIRADVHDVYNVGYADGKASATASTGNVDFTGFTIEKLVLQQNAGDGSHTKGAYAYYYLKMTDASYKGIKITFDSTYTGTNNPITAEYNCSLTSIGTNTLYIVPTNASNEFCFGICALGEPYQERFTTISSIKSVKSIT